MPRQLAITVCVLLLWALAPAAASGASVASPPSGPPATADGPDGRIGLAGRWLFRLDPADTGLQDGLQDRASTRDWLPVTVPHSWNAADESDASMVGTVGWYRRDFTLPPTGGKPEWLVRFLSVNHFARVWLNGREIGGHAGAYLPFELKLTGVRRRRVNRLVIRVDNRRRPIDFPPGSGLSGGWWNYGGILREVEVRPAFGVDLEDVRALPRLRCSRCPGRVRVRAVVRNHADRAQRVDVRARLGGLAFRLGGKKLPAGGRGVVGGTVKVAEPRLWSPADPHLYSLAVDAVGERGTARHRLKVGIRSVTVTDGLLRLNDRRLRPRGVGVHEDEPGRGHALLPTGRERLVSRARRLGATMIRSHYPLHPHILEMADRLGLLVWSEVPVYRFRSALGRPGVVDRAIELSRANVEANASHPSIITWSLGNELSPVPGPVEADLFARGAAAVREIDPTRPVSLALQTARPFVCHAATYAPLDLIGLNEYFGWYSAQTADLSPYLDAMRACYPEQALMITEFGAEANRSGPVTEKGTYEFQSAWTGAHLGVFASKPYLSGVSYWALNEFKVRPGWAGGNPLPDPPMHRKGLISYLGRPKPAYLIVQRAYTPRRRGSKR
ncbi:MAG: hypothetical protein M3P50_13745 [Actinomycetota bacterium]|nr:hypothetical protein [Actinomycetota bacterium]